MTYSSGGFDWSSRSWLSIFHFPILLPFSFLFGASDLCPLYFLHSVLQPHPFHLSFWSVSIDWTWQIIPIRLHLAQSGCMRVRVLTLYELVMRDGLVVTVIYYGSGRKWCCDDFSPVAACPPAYLWDPYYAFTSLQDYFRELNSSAQFEKLWFCAAKKCLNVIYHPSSTFPPLFKGIAQNENAKMQWSASNGLTEPFMLSCSHNMVLFTFYSTVI